MAAVGGDITPKHGCSATSGYLLPEQAKKWLGTAADASAISE